MNHTCTLVTYTLVLLLSLLLYCAELGFHLTVALQLFQENQHIWLSLVVGLLVVPMVTTQCVSIYQSWDAFSSTTARIIWTVLHTLMLALPARYTRLLLYSGTVDVQKELADTMQLRSFLTFSSALPLTLLEVYIVFTGQLQTNRNVILIATAGASVLSSAVTLSTFRKRQRDYRYLESIISWPGIIFKLLWRFGELGSRIVVLALFTQLYSLWIFMVIVGHWICMLVSLLMETKLTSKSSNKIPQTKSVLRILATSYAYIFCYLNVTTKPEKYRFVIFYLIMSVENALLLLLWLMFDDRNYLHLIVSTTTCVTFVVSLVSAMVYYHCFHITSNDKLPASSETHYIQHCINCKLNLCVKHDPTAHAPRPYEGDWWVEVKASSNSDHDSTDYLYPSEYMINSKDFDPGVKTAVLVPVQDLTEEGKGRIRYFKYYRDTRDTGSAATSASGTYLIPYLGGEVDSVSDTYSWDNYDLENEIQDGENPDAIEDDVADKRPVPDANNEIEEIPDTTDTGTQPRDSNKPSDSGFSGTSSRSGSRLSPFSQGEYVLYISDNEDSDFSTSFVSTEQGGVGASKPIRYYLSDQWSVTTSTTENTLEPKQRQSRRLLYRLPGGLAKLQETKGGASINNFWENLGFQHDAEAGVDSAPEGRVVLLPVRMCKNCGSSTESSPGVVRRENLPHPRPATHRKAASERMLAERRRARKHRMANAKLISRNRQHFKSQMAQLRRRMESSGLSDADCSVVGVVLSSCPSDVTSSNEKLTPPKGKAAAIIQAKNNSSASISIASPSKQKTNSSKSQRKKKDLSNAKSLTATESNNTKKKKPWELTPENTIQFRVKDPGPRRRDLSPGGFELDFAATTENPNSVSMEATEGPSVIMEDGNATLTV